MLKKVFLIITLIVFSSHSKSQTYFDCGVSFGANATTSRTIKSNNMTWGYYTPPLPSTWSNHLYFGWGTEKWRIYASFDDGGLGPTMAVKAYPNKYPYYDTPDNGTTTYRAPVVQGRSRANSNLSKLSLVGKRRIFEYKGFEHYGLLGLGYLKTRVAKGGSVFGMAFYANDTLGWVNHSFVQDKYEYFRNQNAYIIFGYEMSYKFAKRWRWNVQLFYNQGFYKMIRWHTFRTYSESGTGYTEFDEQWSFTRLSYFALLSGVSFEFGNFVKKK